MEKLGSGFASTGLSANFWTAVGLALALALLFVKTFPKLGAGAAALVFGGVAINEMLAPVLYRYALVKTGEAGQAKRVEAGEPVHASVGH